MILIKQKDSVLEVKAAKPEIIMMEGDETLQVHSKDGAFATVLNVLDLIGAEYKIEEEN